MFVIQSLTLPKHPWQRVIHRAVRVLRTVVSEPIVQVLHHGFGIRSLRELGIVTFNRPYSLEWI